ncbi:MAG: type VI secretion system contractile sheath large subunit [Planctomycetes bacterium]|nr:type VI secretion system contractile sheath large subunit [Planctomycetota bacterium]
MSDDGNVKGFSNDIGFGPTGHPEAKPLPFRIMCVADFGGASHESDGPIQVDAHDFDSVINRIGPHLFFTVENHLGGEKTFDVDARLHNVKDFEPARLAESIPALKLVSELAARLEGLSKGDLSPNDFKKDLGQFNFIPALKAPLDDALSKLGLPGTKAVSSESTEPSKQSAGGSALDNIFDMVSGGSTVDPAASAVENIASAAGQSAASGAGVDVSSELAVVRGLLSKQLLPIVEHPQTRALEAAWRGLRLLCKRGMAVSIEILDVNAEYAFEIFKSKVLEPELAGTTPAALSMIVLDQTLENSPAGLNAIQSFSEAALQIQAPVVFSLGEAFYEEPVSKLFHRDAPANLFDNDIFDKWRSFTYKDPARWAMAATNGWLARRPYNARKHGLDESTPLFSQPAWLVACAVASSMERTGWPSSHTGISDGEIEQLPTVEIDGKEIPLQSTMPDNAMKDLAKGGLTPLTCQENHDSAWLTLAPVIKLQDKNDDPKEATLAYQLFAARLANLLVDAKGNLVVSGDEAASAENYAKFLTGMLAGTGPGASVDIEVDSASLLFHIKTGRALLGGVGIKLGVPLG